ncbi:hypothetical protein CONLIGDRAFT_687826 [Coniochaeta ligniaria NRRL 30616]|uniref:Uncharacterized protein n=1 Tax=Coniochaeta ligniaria NRRL 30616 TaxID=1408157 RepID=A0A1J7I3E0_9PEZI|nr:hypothetical protein CONLIGDRAFT_687826 [Coniochaeta ligniaria NRRL 30616]
MAYIRCSHRQKPDALSHPPSLRTSICREVQFATMRIAHPSSKHLTYSLHRLQSIAQAARDIHTKPPPTIVAFPWYRHLYLLHVVHLQKPRPDPPPFRPTPTSGSFPISAVADLDWAASLGRRRILGAKNGKSVVECALVALSEIRCAAFASCDSFEKRTMIPIPVQLGFTLPAAESKVKERNDATRKYEKLTMIPNADLGFTPFSDPKLASRSAAWQGRTVIPNSELHFTLPAAAA